MAKSFFEVFVFKRDLAACHQLLWRVRLGLSIAKRMAPISVHPGIRDSRMELSAFSIQRSVKYIVITCILLMAEH